MTTMRCATPTWIADKPTPGAAYIVSSMSSINVRTSSSTALTGCETSRNRGSGAVMIGRIAIFSLQRPYLGASRQTVKVA